MRFCRLLNFFKIKFFEKKFHEYCQRVKEFGSRSDPKKNAFPPKPLDISIFQTFQVHRSYDVEDTGQCFVFVLDLSLKVKVKVK